MQPAHDTAGAPEAPPPSAPFAAPRAVRISITDACDLACVYCRASRNDALVASVMDRAAWRTVVEAFSRIGVRRVRITGGEPLVHPLVVDIVRDVAAAGIEDVALTTNATRLSELARPLRDAGLRRLNVSLDTLDPDRFARITRGGRLASVLDGIETALAVGHRPIKTNCVVMRGVNDDELARIVEWSWERGLVPRFIELMSVGVASRMAPRSLVTAQEMSERLAHLLEPGVPAAEPDRGPAVYLRARRDPSLRVGFITGASAPFCSSCDRVRVTSEGTLRPCLAIRDGVRVGRAARAGDVDAVAAAIVAAWKGKPDPSRWRGCAEAAAANVSMRATGG